VQKTAEEKAAAQKTAAEKMAAWKAAAQEMVTAEVAAEKVAAVQETGALKTVVEFARDSLGFEADERQAEVLESSARRGILNCTRQWGKSTVAGIKALHRALMTPESLVMVASPTERQSGEFLRKSEVLLARTGVRPRGDGKNPLSLLLPNGSRIVGLPGTEGTVRGFSSVSLMVIDEASRVPDDVYKALWPMLAVEDGDLWLLSTPWGKQGFFYENWEHGDTEWERVTVRAAECPRIRKEFLEEEREQMGNAWFAQEYLCEFVDNGRNLFRREVVRGALEDREPLGL
jgi:hypothetical protein